jgi:hypothetical protein
MTELDDGYTLNLKHHVGMGKVSHRDEGTSRVVAVRENWASTFPGIAARSRFLRQFRD